MQEIVKYSVLNDELDPEARQLSLEQIQYLEFITNMTVFCGSISQT